MHCHARRLVADFRWTATKIPTKLMDHRGLLIMVPIWKAPVQAKRGAICYRDRTARIARSTTSDWRRSLRKARHLGQADKRLFALPWNLLETVCAPIWRCIYIYMFQSSQLWIVACSQLMYVHIFSGQSTLHKPQMQMTMSRYVLHTILSSLSNLEQITAQRQSSQSTMLKHVPFSNIPPFFEAQRFSIPQYVCSIWAHTPFQVKLTLPNAQQAARQASFNLQIRGFVQLASLRCEEVRSWRRHKRSRRQDLPRTKILPTLLWVFFQHA